MCSPNVDNEQVYIVGLRNMLTGVADCGKEIVITGEYITEFLLVTIE